MILEKFNLFDVMAFMDDDSLNKFGVCKKSISLLVKFNTIT